MNNDGNITSKIGNPRFLQGVQWCINKRCELLGVKKTDAGDKKQSVTFSDMVRALHEDK